MRRPLTVLIACLLVAGTVTAQTAPQGSERLLEQLAKALATCKALASQVMGYDVVFRRDPMRPLINDHGDLATSSGLHGGLSVEGVIWSDARPLAVIDDELVAQGAVVGPYTVLQIQPDGVVVQRQGESPLFVPLDRGLETPQERPIDSSSQ